MPRKNDGAPGPPPQRLHTLKDGFWEDTAVYQLADGRQVVHKANKPASKPGPWALLALREEIRYLKESKGGIFPPLLRSWDYQDHQGMHVGLEIPFYQDHQSVAQHVLENAATQNEADQFQHQLAKHLFRQVHRPVPQPHLRHHLHDTLTSTCQQLGQIDRFHTVIHDSHIVLNGQAIPGLQTLLAQAEAAKLFDLIEHGPMVRLHGDLILENILIPKANTNTEEEFILIDPVSVAGISAGPPLMDLVKYESYARGDLLAVRSEWFLQAGPSQNSDGYAVALQSDHPKLRPFNQTNWHHAFRQAFIEHHGPIDQQLYHLLDAYYALVMAVNTSGSQQWARVLLGMQSLHAAMPT